MKDFIIRWICILAFWAILATLCVGVWRVCEPIDTGTDTTIVDPDQKTIDNAWSDYSTASGDTISSNTTATDQPITISLPPGVEIDQEMWDVFNILAGRGRVTVVLGSAMMEFYTASDLLDYPNIEVQVGD